jgi:hypothetical protein
MAGGWWTNEVPCFKEIVEIGNGIDLGDGSGRLCILEGTGYDFEAMDDFVFRSGQRYGAVGMTELRCV